MTMFGVKIGVFEVAEFNADVFLVSKLWIKLKIDIFDLFLTFSAWRS